MAWVAAFCTAPAWAAPEQFEGVWRSEGYGNVYEVRGSVLRSFEVTSRTCVAGFTARRITSEAPGQEAFRVRHGDVFFVSPAGDDDHKLLRYRDGLYSIRIDRLPEMPAVCAVPTANTPRDNFEVFTRNFAEQYIAFDLRHIGWDGMTEEARRKITPQTSDEQLFDLLDGMLKPLGDLHTGLEAPGLKREHQDVFRAGTDRVIQGDVKNFDTRGRRALFAVTDRYLHGPLLPLCRGQILFGHVDDATGYIRILGFGDYARHGGDRRALELALDHIFADAGLRALIIDVRLSFGGDDKLGLAIASRLTGREYAAYTIAARADAAMRDPWTPADTVLVRPSSRPGFRGPVVELIGPITMSAAETFSQALMGRTPHVTRIGENTQGVFCDVLERRLPNGWILALPNAVYRTAEGAAFDVTGIAPDIAAPVFTDEDVAAGKDPAMALAVRVLSGQTAAN
jgi:hypothetical protein